LGESTRTSAEEYNAEGASEPGITIQLGYVLSSQKPPQRAKTRHFC
jgi:hypothetical protein